MKTKITQNIKAIILAVIVVIGAGYVSAQGAGVWSPAPANPPSSNVAAPINVGTQIQTKNGSLNIFNNGSTPSIFSAHNIVTSNFTFDGSDNENIRTGKVLTAADSTGRVEWQAPAALVAVTKILAGPRITVSPCSGTPCGGTGDVTISANTILPIATGVMDANTSQDFGSDWKLIQLSGQQNLGGGDSGPAGGFIMKDPSGNISWSLFLGQSTMNTGIGDQTIGTAPSHIEIDVNGSSVSLRIGSNVKLSWIKLN